MSHNLEHFGHPCSEPVHKPDPNFKDCAKCTHSTILDDLDDHDHCIDCAQIVGLERCHESVQDELCSTCKDGMHMHDTDCYLRCDEYTEIFEETKRQWENES